MSKEMTCPKCGKHNIRPSPRQGLVDGLLAVVFLAPFRCRNCRVRFFRFSKRIGNDLALSDSTRPHQDRPTNR